jgi:hypothetical protein
MHRTDLDADLDDTYLFATAKIVNRMMQPGLDINEVLAEQPQVLVHAGLVYLAELAQDDVQMQREQTLFENAHSDMQMQNSLVDNPTISMQRG